MVHDGYAEIAELYDSVPLYRTRPDVDFYVEAARAASGAVLEIGCGTGRVLIPTARAGIDIVGVDGSAQMLAICRRRLADETREVQSRVQLIEGDMRRFTIGRRFRLATIPFRPFQHLLTVDDQLACLRTIRDHLDDDGLLIFDIFNPSLDILVKGPFGEEFGDEPEFTMADGRRVVRRQRIVAHDRFSQVTEHELIYHVTFPDGRTERVVHAVSLRNTFRFEAEHLLERVGFKVQHLFAGFDRAPYGSCYPGELIFVARKTS